MADNKSSEGNIKGISIQFDIDAFGAIKGLKAIQLTRSEKGDCCIKRIGRTKE